MAGIDDVFSVEAADIGEEVIRLSPDMATLTFYAENEVVPEIPYDGVKAFADAVRRVVDHVEACEHGFWVDDDLMDVLRAALGIKEQPAWPVGAKPWYERWREREIPADAPEEDG